ncbi:hypothetical protein ACHAXA_004344 [Cyclostephanos tholiformis]|uniref:Uncharacterized protein n=1 Tax=Cyclostephanos tholiformis TaxID=382380 RepID=A0ABD3SQG8_9STRA
MREIPSLRILALRAVGPPGCDAEVTFGGTPASANNVDDDDADDDVDDSSAGGESPSARGRVGRGDHPPPLASEDVPTQPTMTSRLLDRLRDDATHLPIRPYVGPGRPNAADVDISHPWIMAAYPPRQRGEDGSNCLAPLMTTTTKSTTTTTTTTNNNNNIPVVAVVVDGAENNNGGGCDEARGHDVVGGGGEFLAIEHGNHAVECLQQFIDALVESGRASDTRMGVRFFREWTSAVVGRSVMVGWEGEVVRDAGRGGGGVAVVDDSLLPRTPSKKRQKIASSTANVDDDATIPLGSLSLHNFSAGSIRTFRSMEKANVGRCLGTLDVTGVHGLTDSILSNVICGGSFARLRRLSVKNCRKLTGRGISSLVGLPNLRALDVGGCFNVLPDDVISLVRCHPSTRRGGFEEIYASGLGWTDVALEEIVDVTVGQLRALGVGFSPYISGPGLILTLSKLSSTLEHLAFPFCAGMDDAVASALGKALPRLAVLDIRGCNKVYSLSGMMEGRAGSAIAKHLFVLARYSGISVNSLDETLRLYDSEKLTCILDGGGTGGGIRR